MICKIDGCEKKHEARGWCDKHYMRWRKYGNPLFVKTHGYRKHPIYRVWKAMKGRCYNPNFTYYKYYGGRGIIICDEWKNNSRIFIEWALSHGWESGLYIDRRNNDSNYNPNNCHFVTPKVSANNRRPRNSA